MPSIPRPLLFAVSLSLLLGVGAGQAWAQEIEAPRQAVPAQPRTPPPAMVRPPPQRDMSDSVRRVKESTGGQILGVERVPFEGRNINRVKYVDGQGRVRYMDDPPSPRFGGSRDGGQERPERRRRDNPADP